MDGGEGGRGDWSFFARAVVLIGGGAGLGGLGLVVMEMETDGSGFGRERGRFNQFMSGEEVGW